MLFGGIFNGGFCIWIKASETLECIGFISVSVFHTFNSTAPPRLVSRGNYVLIQTTGAGLSFYSLFVTIIFVVGDSPSGKAPGSGPGIRGFESLIPSHKEPFACESTEADGSFSVKVNLFAVFKYG